MIGIAWAMIGAAYQREGKELLSYGVETVAQKCMGLVMNSLAKEWRGDGIVKIGRVMARKDLRRMGIATT